ncbi:unnamed protein product [Lepeophtheirus salmonis]|uniref:(salmon louse) hypothetical protein n=1 Tax=Lepeophtheirus salmonis TaxID=72036 RepID=A0A7R8CAC7_LEPSM|nr:unnamed protein product [Lepeophtheirus salmonis]CAF2749637.1 unnamed protein product [Lepeophtheirus salmonis]
MYPPSNNSAFENDGDSDDERKTQEETLLSFLVKYWSPEEEKVFLKSQIPRSRTKGIFNIILYLHDVETCVGSNIGQFSPVLNEVESEGVMYCKLPHQLWRLFQPGNHIEEIISQSRLFAHPKGRSNKAIDVTEDSILCVYAVMLLSGYSKVPNKMIYVEDTLDGNDSIISENIKRDNSKMSCHLSMKYMPAPQSLRVDEIMIPYYGSHGENQFICEKPVKFGFKLWALCSSSGHIVFVEPYCKMH